MYKAVIFDVGHANYLALGIPCMNSDKLLFVVADWGRGDAKSLHCHRGI